MSAKRRALAIITASGGVNEMRRIRALKTGESGNAGLWGITVYSVCEIRFSAMANHAAGRFLTVARRRRLAVFKNPDVNPVT